MLYKLCVSVVFLGLVGVAICVQVPTQAKTAHQIPLKLELQTIQNNPMWVLGAEPRSSARTVSIRNP